MEQVFDWDLGGTARLVDIDLETSDTSHTVYLVREGDPLSAEVRFHATSGMGRGDWSMRSEVTSSMASDPEAFDVTTTLEVHEREERIFARTWTAPFPARRRLREFGEQALRRQRSSARPQAPGAPANASTRSAAPWRPLETQALRNSSPARKLPSGGGSSVNSRPHGKMRTSSPSRSTTRKFEYHGL